MTPKVSNLYTSRGRSAPNQFIITTPDGTWFQSYATTIAYNSRGHLYLDPNWSNYSRTTSRYLCQFTGLSKSEILTRIDQNQITLGLPQ